MAEKGVDIRVRLRQAAKFVSDSKRSAQAVRQIGTEADRAAAKSAKAGRGFGMFNRNLTGMQKGAKRARGALAGMARQAAGVAAAYVGIAQAKKAVSTTTDLAKATLGLSRNFGMGIDQASQWAAVAKNRDIDSKSLNMSFTKLARTHTEAVAGGEKQIAMFKTLGVSQDEIKAGTKDFSGLLMNVADGFGKLKGGTERQAAAQQVLGRGFQTVLPLFKEGSKTIKEQMALAVKYGATFGDTTAEKLGNLIAAQREAKMATLGLQVQFGKGIAPILTKGIGLFTKLVSAINALPKGAKYAIAGAFAIGAALVAGPIGIGIAAVVAGALLIKKHWSTIGPIFDKVKDWVVGAFKSIKPEVSSLGSTFAGMLPALQNIGKMFKWVFLKIWLPVAKRALPGIIQVLKGGLQIIKGVVQVFTGIFTGDFRMMWQGVKNIFGGAVRALVGVLRWMTAPFRAILALVGRIIGGGFRKAFGLAKAIVGLYIGAIKLIMRGVVGYVRLVVKGIVAAWNWLKGAAGSVTGFVKDKFNSVVGFFKGMPGKIAGAVRGMFDGIKGAFKSAVNWIINKWNDLSFTVGGTDLGPLGHLPKMTVNTPDMPTLGTGGIARMSGAAIVGDRGPEVMHLPVGARVDPLPSRSSVERTPKPAGGLRQRITLYNNQPVIIDRHEVGRVMGKVVEDALADE